MPYGIRIELNGEDVTDQVSRFEITAELEAYCREISVDIADPTLYDTIDFSVLPEFPSIEVFTRIETDWTSQGKFFIEKPTFQVGIHRTETGLWGRSETAVLGPPFSVKFTKTWDADTSFFTICTEMCTAVGLTWDSAYSEIADFTIHAGTYTAENLSPVEILQELIELAYGDDAFLTTDRYGNVWVRLRDRTPSVIDHSISDLVTASISEEPEWPDFGNRIRITSTGSTSGYSVAMTAPTVCLSGDGTTRVPLYARVTDSDGEPVNNLAVSWAAENGLVTLDKPVTNTQTIFIFDEQVRAKSFYELDLSLPPAIIRGIWAYRDTWHADNLASMGTSIDGNTVTLVRRLDYCDQLLNVSYVVDGTAVNWATSGILSGNETVTADVSGQSASVNLYVDNPCNCPPMLTLSANPSSIIIGEGSSLLAYAEIGGAPIRDGRLVWMTLDSYPWHGRIIWTKQPLGEVTIRNELTQVKNEVSGVSQATLSMFADSVIGIFLVATDGEGNKSKTGSNLYSSHSGKTVDLNTSLSSETELLCDYMTIGAAVNIYEGYAVGTDRVRAFLTASREVPVEATVSIMVHKDDPHSDPESPEDCCEDGLCVNTGTPCGADAAECEEGTIWCLRDGVYGCHSSGECDTCGEAQVLCLKDGVEGCYSSGECDTSHTDGGTQRVYGFSGGVEGCWPPDQLDICVADKVMCFKGGQEGCYAVGECDTAYGVTEPQQCMGDTTCCVHQETGQQGCWPASQCKKITPGDEHDKDPDTTQCSKSDGSYISCTGDNKCCESGGVKGCWPADQCDDPAGCNTTSCANDPTDECLSSRFGALAMGCSCAELCEQEFSNYETVQTYEGSSYRTVSEIVTDDYGLSPGTPEYDEKYDELKTGAINECLEQCGDCVNAGNLSVFGPDALTAPGGYQYYTKGGLAPFTWEASGAGATIDETGYLTLETDACGKITITVTDACGVVASMTARVTNAGEWGPVQYQELQVTGTGVHNIYWGLGICTPCPDEITGAYKKEHRGVGGYYCNGGSNFCAGGISSTGCMTKSENPRTSCESVCGPGYINNDVCAETGFYYQEWIC